MAIEKDDVIKARVSASMKKKLEAIAEGRDEKVSVIVREAINFYLSRYTESSDPLLLNEGKHRPPKQSGSSYR